MAPHHDDPYSHVEKLSLNHRMIRHYSRKRFNKLGEPVPGVKPLPGVFPKPKFWDNSAKWIKVTPGLLRSANAGQPTKLQIVFQNFKK